MVRSEHNFFQAAVLFLVFIGTFSNPKAIAVILVTVFLLDCSHFKTWKFSSFPTKQKLKYKYTVAVVFLGLVAYYIYKIGIEKGAL